MHTVEHGIMKIVLECTIGAMTDGQKIVIDNLVEKLFSANGSNRSGERSLFPRVCFKNGFCSLTLLTADEHVGQIFVLSLLLQFDEGIQAMTPRFAATFDQRREKGNLGNDDTEDGLLLERTIYYYPPPQETARMASLFISNYSPTITAVTVVVVLG